MNRPQFDRQPDETATSAGWKRHLLPILAVLIFAAALRILGAGSYPVWTDEGWSIWAARDPAQVISLIAADRHPPLYFAALSLWRQAAGDTLIALRWLSIAGGLITVAAVYRVGADSFGRRAGLFAALLLAALPSAVYYAQEVRHYGWLTLFTALSWLVFLRYLRRPRRALWIAYVLSLAALLYTLYFGVLTIAAQIIVGVIWVFRRGDLTGHPVPTENLTNGAVGAHDVRPKTVALIAAWLTAAILYLPWLYVIVTQQANILSSGINGAPGTLSAGDVVPTLQILFSTQMAIPLLAFALGAWALLRRANLQRIALLLGGGGLFAAMFILSLRFNFLAARTLIFLTPLLMIICGYGLSRIDKRIAALLTGAWLILTLTLPTIIQPRLRSDLAARALASAYQPGDAVILEAGWDDNAFAYEIEQALPAGADITRTLPWTNDRTGGAPVVPQIEPVLQRHARVWIVQWLQAAQVLPFLEGGGDGYQLTQTLDISAGDYGERFFSPIIQIRLFERPT